MPSLQASNATRRAPFCGVSGNHDTRTAEFGSNDQGNAVQAKMSVGRPAAADPKISHDGKPMCVGQGEVLVGEPDDPRLRCLLRPGIESPGSDRNGGETNHALPRQQARTWTAEAAPRIGGGTARGSCRIGSRKVTKAIDVAFNLFGHSQSHRSAGWTGNCRTPRNPRTSSKDLLLGEAAPREQHAGRIPLPKCPMTAPLLSPQRTRAHQG